MYVVIPNEPSIIYMENISLLWETYLVHIQGMLEKGDFLFIFTYQWWYHYWKKGSNSTPYLKPCRMKTVMVVLWKTYIFQKAKTFRNSSRTKSWIIFHSLIYEYIYYLYLIFTVYTTINSNIVSIIDQNPIISMILIGCLQRPIRILIYNAILTDVWKKEIYSYH